MSSLTTIARPAAASAALLRPGVPFSTRLFIGAKTKSPAVVMGNRAFIRAWTARRAASHPPVAGEAN